MKNKMNQLAIAKIEALIDMAINEDLGQGDVTSELFDKNNAVTCAKLVTREPIIVCGMVIAETILKKYDENLNIDINIKDGEKADKNDVIATITGPVTSLLSSERVLLNFVQRLSGVATLTNKYVTMIEKTSAKIYDTRKTTPGWRALEKYAVTAGGGHNHRLGLYDAVLIKDNHLAELGANLAEKLPSVIDKAKTYSQIKFVEVEVDSLDQLKQIIDIDGIDIILLDNMTESELQKAIAIRQASTAINKPLFEASGNVTLSNIKAVAGCGVERIAIGAITHSATCVDIGLDR